MNGILEEVRRSPRFPDVLAVVLFGSAARGDDTPASDLDVLVVVDGPHARRLGLRDIGATFEPIVFSRDGLLLEAELKPSFVSHLLDEGLELYTAPGWGELRRAARGKASDPLALRGEVDRRAHHLVPLHQAERFQHSPVTAMAQIYGVARSLVIARLLERGIREYSWRRAFDRYAEVRPELRPDLDAIKALRPYYDYAHDRPGAELPLQWIPPGELRALVAAAERLAT